MLYLAGSSLNDKTQLQILDGQGKQTIQSLKRTQVNTFGPGGHECVPYF